MDESDAAKALPSRPNIKFAGESLDEATARVAIEAPATGTSVICTIAASDATAAMNRFLESNDGSQRGLGKNRSSGRPS